MKDHLETRIIFNKVLECSIMPLQSSPTPLNLIAIYFLQHTHTHTRALLQGGDSPAYIIAAAEFSSCCFQPTSHSVIFAPLITMRQLFVSSHLMTQLLADALALLVSIIGDAVFIFLLFPFVTIAVASLLKEGAIQTQQTDRGIFFCIYYIFVCVLKLNALGKPIDYDKLLLQFCDYKSNHCKTFRCCGVCSILLCAQQVVSIVSSQHQDVAASKSCRLLM